MALQSGCFLHKKNPSDVSEPFDAQRLVRSLDPVGKGFFKHLYSSASLPTPASYEFGNRTYRRREGAIKTQLIKQERLALLKLSSSLSSRDGKTPFLPDSKLDSCINVNPLGVFQNVPKQEVVLSLHVSGAHACHRSLKHEHSGSPSLILPHLLYLGAYIQENGLAMFRNLP